MIEKGKYVKYISSGRPSLVGRTGSVSQMNLGKTSAFVHFPPVGQYGAADEWVGVNALEEVNEVKTALQTLEAKKADLQKEIDGLDAALKVLREIK